VTLSVVLGLISRMRTGWALDDSVHYRRQCEKCTAIIETHAGA
jgi:hypothetical protein